MVELFLEGGPFMWPILLLLLAGLGSPSEGSWHLGWWSHSVSVISV